jgi:NADPH:quinone reductase-like Zn-dependent oxidoreductase
VQCKLPDNISDEDASTLGVGVTTVGQGLYQSLGLPLPGAEKANYPLLVYGGSTATGSLAIQFGVLSGCQVITTCSPRNFPFVKALGAVEAFDYNDPDCAKKIREYTNDKLTRVFDCISEGDSPKISSEAISSEGGQVSYLLAPKHDRTDVENKVSFHSSIAESLQLFRPQSLTHSTGYSRLHPHRRSIQMGWRYGHACEAAGLRVREDVLGIGYEASCQPAAHRAPSQGWFGRA